MLRESFLVPFEAAVREARAGNITASYNEPSRNRSYLFADSSPLFRFGHGLSYTSFRYDDLNVAPNPIRAGASATVSVTVTNTGQREGGRSGSDVYPPARRIRDPSGPGTAGT
jgi:hypothetical protein